MKLKKLLVAHQKHSNSESLAGNLGDGYLLAHNPIFLSVRLAAKKAGLKFSPLRFHHYDSLPLTQLPKILVNQTIPYVDNVMALKEIEKTAPGVFTLAEAPPLRANYVLHESAHGVAHELRKKYLKNPDKIQSLKDQRNLALMILIEEAFANAAESLMCVYSSNPTHEAFLRKNTYILENEVTRERLKSAVNLVGLSATFRLTLLSFLFANLLKTQVSATEFKRVLAIVFSEDQTVLQKLTKKQIEQLKAVFIGGFDLDPVFTIRTNQFCLRLLGIKTKLPKLFAFDFMQFFEKNEAYSQLLQTMSEAILRSQ